MFNVKFQRLIQSQMKGVGMSILKTVGTALDSILTEYRVLPNINEMFSLKVMPADPMKLAELTGLKTSVFLGPYQERRIYKKIRMINFDRVSCARAQELATNMGGRLLKGQAYESFLKQYPLPNKNGPDVILFGTSEWQTWQRNTPLRHIACICKERDENSWTVGLTWSKDTTYNGVWPVIFD